MRENFKDIVNFFSEIGDIEVQEHLQQCSRRATYISTTSVDQYLSVLNDFVQDKLLTSILTAKDFSVLADETTDISDRAELAVFVRFVDGDSHEIKEKFVGLAQIKGSKGSAAVCQKIKDVFVEKGIDLSNLRFSGLDGTNSMSGEISGLQRRLRHLAPHAKYINSRNHRCFCAFNKRI